MSLFSSFPALPAPIPDTTAWDEAGGDEEEFDDEARPHVEDVCEEGEPGPEAWSEQTDDLA